MDAQRTAPAPKRRLQTARNAYIKNIDPLLPLLALAMFLYFIYRGVAG
jgi:hypothetical protein